MERSETGKIASASQPAPAGARAPGPIGRRLLGSLFEVRHPRHFRHVLQKRPESYQKGLGLREAQSRVMTPSS